MSRTDEPLLEVPKDGGAESSGCLKVAAKVGDFSRYPCTLTIDTNEYSIKLEYEIPVSVLLAGFELCAPRKNVVEIIDRDDLIGYESKWLGAQDHSVRLLYMPVVGLKTNRPVRELKKTPWLVVDSLDTLDKHIRLCVPKKNILLIVNPKSGKGDAEILIEKNCMPILEAAGACVDKFVTESPRHATKIVRDINVSQYDVILSAGGDGTFHEILQGLLNRDDWKRCIDSVSLVQVPCGSGNALAASSGIWDVSTASYTALRGRKTKIDIATIVQPSTGMVLFSFLSVTFGLIANLDIGTEHLRWMGGQRFIWGALREIFSQRMYACDVMYVEADDLMGDATAQGTLKHPPLQFLGPLLSEDGTCTHNCPVDERWNRLSGDYQLFSMSNLPWLDMNFNLHPHADMSGGTYNFLYCLGKQGIMKSMKLMTASEQGNHMHLVQEKNIRAFRIDPIAENTWLVIDGEAIERAPIYGEIHPQLLCILLPH